MDKFEELNRTGQLEFKEFKTLKGLELNKRYRIEKMEKTKAKFGPTIIVDLEEFKVHLPNRFINVLDEKKIRGYNKLDNFHLVVTEIRTIKDKETALLRFE